MEVEVHMLGTVYIELRGNNRKLEDGQDGKNENDHKIN